MLTQSDVNGGVFSAASYICIYTNNFYLFVFIFIYLIFFYHHMLFLCDKARDKYLCDFLILYMRIWMPLSIKSQI